MHREDTEGENRNTELTEDPTDDNQDWMVSLLEDVFVHDVKRALSHAFTPNAKAVQEHIKVSSPAILIFLQILFVESCCHNPCLNPDFNKPTSFRSSFLIHCSCLKMLQSGLNRHSFCNTRYFICLHKKYDTLHCFVPTFDMILKGMLVVLFADTSGHIC